MDQGTKDDIQHEFDKMMEHMNHLKDKMRDKNIPGTDKMIQKIEDTLNNMRNKMMGNM